jgi:CHAD domain-containing protein
MQKPVRKIRKLLKKMPSSPSPDEVHDLRTNSRRIEATLHALALDSGRPGRQVLKEISKLRKRAGKVRDMDVLTSYASQLSCRDGERECLVDLLEYLGAQRQKYAKKLDRVRKQYASALRKQLKQISREMDKALPRNGSQDSGGNTVNTEAAASALHLLSELTKPAHLSRNNLHPYRLKVKELRNVLEMAKNAKEEEFVKRLGEVKDAIGEWHDWEELLAIGKDVLDHRPNCQVLAELRKTADAKFKHALSLAESMRKQFLRVSDPARKRSSRGNARGPAEPVWSATAALAA